MKIQPGNHIPNISKIKFQKVLNYDLKPNHFSINNPFCLLSIYIYIHSYIKYTNVAWGSTYMTNWKKLSSQQKHTMSIICNKGNFSITKQLFQSNKILNIYKLNILNVATFMYNVNQKTAPNIFLWRFQKPSHSYPTRFSKRNYVQPIHKVKTGKYSIWIRGPSMSLE